MSTEYTRPAAIAALGFAAAQSESAINSMYPRKNQSPELATTSAADRHPTIANPIVMIRKKSDFAIVPP
jgi:hypothetical protein